MKLIPLHAAGALAALGVSLGATAAAASTTFSDQTFPLANYSFAFEVLSAPDNTVNLSQCATCGDPGSALELQVGFPSGGGVYNTNNLFGILNSTFTYDPATQGAIKSINASIDKDFSINVALLYGNSFRPLIEQGGNFYETAISGPLLSGPGTTGFNTIAATGLTASSFVQVDPVTGAFGTANPDFSGGPMEFGLLQLLGASAIENTQADLVYDNLSLTLTSVPEPATWAMMLVGFGGLGAAIRTRHRRTAWA